MTIKNQDFPAKLRDQAVKKVTMDEAEGRSVECGQSRGVGAPAR